MARLRTHHKRARRVAKRDQAEMDHLFAELERMVVKDCFAKACQEFAKQFGLAAASMATAMSSMAAAWRELDPRYAAWHLKNQQRVNDWPEVVYEDILDAEVIE
jgi:hypothetical protein